MSIKQQRRWCNLVQRSWNHRWKHSESFQAFIWKPFLIHSTPGVLLHNFSSLCCEYSNISWWYLYHAPCSMFIRRRSIKVMYNDAKLTKASGTVWKDDWKQNDLGAGNGLKNLNILFALRCWEVWMFDRWIFLPSQKYFHKISWVVTDESSISFQFETSLLHRQLTN